METEDSVPNDEDWDWDEEEGSVYCLPPEQQRNSPIINGHQLQAVDSVDDHFPDQNIDAGQHNNLSSDNPSSNVLILSLIHI